MAIDSLFVVALFSCFCWLAHLPSVELISSPDLLQYVYGLCNTANFASNSTFSHNLDTVNGILLQRSSASLFNNATVITNSSSSSSDNVYGFYQCRGDLSLSDCSACVSNIVSIAVCSSSFGARTQLVGCFLRYESYNFFPQPDHLVVTEKCTESPSPTSASFQRNLASLLKATAEEAPADGGFYSSSRGSGDNTAYAIAQCLGYLTPSQCANCLQTYDYNIVCPNASAADIYYSTCYYRYGHNAYLTK